jgi:hypothetical protein
MSGDTLSIARRVRSKRLRVFSTLVAALDTCVRNAGQLFVLAWFPCVLESVGRIGLEWLIYGWPPRIPEWLLFDHFSPPTWLTPLVNAPLVAMVWAFVLSNICDRNPDRGAVTALGIRRGWIRFELSPAVLLGTAIFVATDIVDGLLRLAQFKLLLAAYPLFEGRDAVFDAAMFDLWARWSVALPILAVSAVAAWSYPIAAQALRTGVLDRARVRTLMRGNRLRLTAVFVLLSLASYQFYTLLRPATEWLVRFLVDPLSWTLGEATVRHVIQFPFDLFWIVVWAVTMAVVMNAMEAPARRAGVRRRQSTILPT